MDNLNPLFSGLSFFLDLRTMSKIWKVIFVQAVSYLCQNQIVEFSNTAIRHYCLPDHGNGGVEESEIEEGIVHMYVMFVCLFSQTSLMATKIISHLYSA